MASFVGGMNTICMGIATGLRIVIGLERPQGERIAIRLERSPITFLSMTPTLLRHHRTATDDAGFEGVRVLHLSGSPSAGRRGRVPSISDGSSAFA